MTATQNAANPYVAYLQEGCPARVAVRFTGVSGDAAGRELTVAGFWDGGTTWKARFAPPAPGGWAFESHSEDPGFNGVTGRLTCTMWSEDEKKANPTRHGFVRVHANEPRAGRCFEYADGTPFLWIGDTWWNWTQRGIHFETFRNLVDDRAKKGFNVGQLFFAANGWGRRSSLLDADCNEPDIGHIQSIERCIAQKYDGSENCKNPGRPKISQEITGLVIRFKKENPHWGYTRIRDYTVHLGYKIGETTVKNILIENGYDPKPDLTRKTTWKEFIKSHWNVLAACDFFSIELFVKGKLVRCMVLFAVDAATRKVEILGLPAQPNGAWMAHDLPYGRWAREPLTEGRLFHRS